MQGLSQILNTKLPVYMKRRSFSGNQNDKTPVQRGFIIIGIISTGELEGYRGFVIKLLTSLSIISTGELEGYRGRSSATSWRALIISTGELEGYRGPTGIALAASSIISTGELEGYRGA